MFGNTLLTGFDPEEQRRRTIWNKGTPIPEYDPGVYLRDYAGRAMCYSDYGKRSSMYGWEYGHIVARSLGGSDAISNLRPEHWKTNVIGGGFLSGLVR